MPGLFYVRYVRSLWRLAVLHALPKGQSQYLFCNSFHQTTPP